MVPNANNNNNNNNNNKIVDYELNDSHSSRNSFEMKKINNNNNNNNNNKIVDYDAELNDSHSSRNSFEIEEDYAIHDIIKPLVKTNFRIATPGQPIAVEDDRVVFPRIVAVGSGNGIHLSPIFDKVIAMTQQQKGNAKLPKVVYIGTPFFDRDDKYESGTSTFRKIGCRCKRLMVAKDCTTPSYDEMRRIVVDWADLIFVSGGNSLFAMLRWQSIGLDLLLKEAATKGTVLCGGSAGCGCWFDSMQTDSLKPEACKYGEQVLEQLTAEQRLDWSFVRIRGLGLGPNVFCIPHVDTVGSNHVARVDIAKRMLLEHSMNDDENAPIYGLGIDEKAAMVYEHGKINIISGGYRHDGIGEATCYVLFVTELRNDVVVTPVSLGTDEWLTMEEIVERAVRSVEAVQNPMDLIVSEDVTNACRHRRGCSGNIEMIVSTNTSDDNALLLSSSSSFVDTTELGLFERLVLNTTTTTITESMDASRANNNNSEDICLPTDVPKRSSSLDRLVAVGLSSVVE
eukprot:CAMPEP_0194227014 /NCGR_PEP_ID=MMETSP0156-20130528/42636_1 /TAXON_ID=33649 /ORGANISM="Thalassionema nitzschioides, Strain L26-B" /LENGTH=511 /DNA_ID=CAMNT_0038959483 /DNA_START=280 /DNA_END=1816 /DNA_ORIENTATION=+